MGRKAGTACTEQRNEALCRFLFHLPTSRVTVTSICVCRIFTLSHKQPLHRATSKQTNITSSSSLPSCQVTFRYETSGSVNEERKQTGSLQAGLQKTRPRLAGFPPMNPTRHNLWGHEANRRLPCREMNPSLLRSDFSPSAPLRRDTP